MAFISGLMRIGRDAEVRRTPSGEPVVNLSLAFNYGKKDADGKRPTTWVDASLWGKRAESLAPYLIKGGLVDVVIGEPHVEIYDGRNGTGAKLVGRIMEIELAGSRQGAQGERTTNQATSTARDYQSAKEVVPAAAQAASSQGGLDDIDEDIPF